MILLLGEGAMKIALSVVVSLLVAPCIALAGPAEDADAVLDKWAAAYSANDPDAVLKLYTPDAIFLGTVSPIIATTPDARRAYFARLPGSGNKTKFTERRTMVLSDKVVLTSGFYDFTIMRDGKANEAQNRYTMVVVKQANGEWLIAHHHSSNKPKPR
jgi:uncharacterized protein (TIGR02246 family)